MLLEKNGKCVTPESINQIALLQVRYNDTLRLIAKGPEAEEALIAFRQLAEDNFGETEEVAPPTLRPVPPVSGKSLLLSTCFMYGTGKINPDRGRRTRTITPGH